MSTKAKVSISGDRELQALLKRLPAMVVAQGGPTDRAVSKAGTVVARRARQLAPVAKRNSKGERVKQSKKSRKIWKNVLKRNIRTKVVKYPTNSVAIIGPTVDVNQAHFMQEKPRRHVLWGKTVTTYRIARNWIVRAFDETKSEQQAAMKRSLQADIDKIMTNGGR